MKFAAEHLRQPALYRAPPEIHLKEPVLGLHEPLREEQIVLILRGNVRDAPAVADDADGSRHALERRWCRRSAAARLKAAAGRPGEIRILRCPRSAATLRQAVRFLMMKDGLLAEYDHEMSTTRKLLERMPDDKLTWKPHVKSMSLGGLGTHLANLPQWAGTILNDTSLRSGQPAAEPRGEDVTRGHSGRVRREHETGPRLDGQDRRRVHRPLERSIAAARRSSRCRASPRSAASC